MTTHTSEEPIHRLTVAVSDGSLRIMPATDGTGSVTIEGKRADEAEVDITAGVVQIRHLPEGSRWFGGSGLRITVTAPPGVDVDVRGGALDVDADMVLGDVSVATASGDVRLGTVGSLRAKAASGDIHVDAAGELRAGVASGDVRAGSIERSLEVSAASGDVRADSVGGGIEVRTASGDINIGHWTGTDLAAKTVSGDVAVTVPPGTRAQLDLRTLSGTVRMPDGPTEDVPDDERVVRRMKFTSVSGDFRLGVA
jgi:DUF4097 and DUF4098 domain-containing protein YvlB